MSKRHNRKRTRSRPRHRDGGKARSDHLRTLSFDTVSSYSSTNSSFYEPSHFQFPASADHWHHTYSAWQNRLQYEQERERAREAQWLRLCGGTAGDDPDLLQPMVKVVTDLFGDIDYEDP